MHLRPKCLCSVIILVFSDKQLRQKDLHCGWNCQSGLRRHSETHGLCGVFQRSLAGSYWNCSLSVLPLAGISKESVYKMLPARLLCILTSPFYFYYVASGAISVGRNSHGHPHLPTERDHSKEKKQTTGKSTPRNASHFERRAPTSGLLGPGCHSWFR